MLTYGNSLEFAKDEPAPVAIRNFFPPENGFIWSTSRWSEISFDFMGHSARGKERADLILELDVFKAEQHFEGQNVLVYLNGLRIGSHFVIRRTTIVIPIDLSILTARDNALTFDTPDACRPSQFGIPDDRQLGLQLFSMQIRPAS